MHLAFVAARRRMEREHDDRAWLAHTTATLGRVEPKRFPGLDKLQTRKRTAPVPWEEQLSAWKTYTTWIGGTVT